MRIKILNQSIMPKDAKPHVWQESESNEEALLDANYIDKSRSLIADALQKGFDVMQMPSGDIMITEVKTVTHQYGWDSVKGRFEKKTVGGFTPANSVEKAEAQPVLEDAGAE